MVGTLSPVCRLLPVSHLQACRALLRWEHAWVAVCGLCPVSVGVQPGLSLCPQELIGKAQLVILHGHQLAANHHYALNLICQQCNELRHHSDLLAEDIKRKQMRLQKTLDLHTRLQQVEFRDTGL